MQEKVAGLTAVQQTFFSSNSTGEPNNSILYTVSHIKVMFFSSDHHDHCHFRSGGRDCSCRFLNLSCLRMWQTHIYGYHHSSIFFMSFAFDLCVNATSNEDSSCNTQTNKEVWIISSVLDSTYRAESWTEHDQDCSLDAFCLDEGHSHLSGNRKSLLSWFRSLVMVL